MIGPEGARLPVAVLLSERTRRREAERARAGVRQLLAAVLCHVGGEVVVSPASLATVAYTGRITVEPTPEGGMAVRFASERPETSENRRSDPDRVSPPTEREEPDTDAEDPHGTGERVTTDG